MIRIFHDFFNELRAEDITFCHWKGHHQVNENLDGEGDLDIFSLWLVDNIYLHVYCKGTDNIIVKEFCVEHFGYEDGALLEN